MTDKLTPETLRALAQGVNPREMDFPEGATILRNSLIRLTDTLLAHADAWEASIQTRHMEAAKFLSQIAAWKASCLDAEARAEALEKAMKIVEDHFGDDEPPEDIKAALAAAGGSR